MTNTQLKPSVVDLSLVIPFFNEENTIGFLLKELNSFCKKIPDLVIQVVLVDDGSSDRTVEIIKSSMFYGFKLKLIILSKNYGSHSALRAGFLNSDGVYSVSIAADLQDPLEVVMRMHTIIIGGKADIVWAKREAYKTNFTAKIFSRFYWSMVRKYVDKKIPEDGYDVFMINNKVKNVLNQNVEGNSSIHIQILSFGFRQSFILYKKEERVAGKSKWTLSKKIKLLIDSFVAFSYAPIRFVSLVGIVFFVVGVTWTTFIVTRKLIYNDLVSGWPALTSILLLGFGITNIGLGIIAEYLWRTLDVSRKRPVFIINEIVELNSENVIS